MSEGKKSAPELAVIDYGMGNLRSVAKALEAVGARVRVVTRPEELREARAATVGVSSNAADDAATAGLVLPGVGALADCISALRASGFDQKIREWIAADRPFLGVCLGMQALFESSEEGLAESAFLHGGAIAGEAAASAVGANGEALIEENLLTPGLGVFPGTVRRFRLPPDYKVPHMGWNTVRFTQPNSPLLEGLETEGEAFYFVHSYYCAPSDRSLVLAECDYGGAFTAAIARGNCYATQFHPEKSQARGLQIYRNFLNLCAKP